MSPQNWWLPVITAPSSVILIKWVPIGSWAGFNESTFIRSEQLNVPISSKLPILCPSTVF